MKQLPQGWSRPALTELCLVNPKHPKDFPDETLVSFVRMAAVDQEAGTITTSRIEVRTLGEVRRGYTHFADGDVIFAKITPCMQNGKSAVAHALENGLACGSTEFFVFRSTGAIEAGWLHSFLRQEAFREGAQRAMTGVVGQARVPRAYLEDHLLPLPPLNEQRRIVDKIEALTAKSRRAKEALDAIPPLLERFRQSVLAAAFRGDLTKEWRAQNPDVEPANQLLARIRKERRTKWEEAQLAKMRAKGKEPKDDKWKAKYKEPEPVDAEGLPELPRGWCWTTIETVGDTRLGRQRSPRYHHGDQMRPYLRVANVFEDRIDITDVMSMNFSDADFEVYQLRAGDVLLNEGQSKELIGRPAIYRNELPGACFTNTLIRFRPWIDFPSPDFALAVFRHYMRSGRFQQIGKITTNISHLGAGRFAALEFPLPPAREQEQILRVLDESLHRVSEIEVGVQVGGELTENFDQSILAKAFRGELVPQDQNDEPASVLLERIRAEREAAGSTAKRTKKRKRRQTSTTRTNAGAMVLQLRAGTVDIENTRLMLPNMTKRTS